LLANKTKQGAIEDWKDIIMINKKPNGLLDPFKKQLDQQFKMAKSSQIDPIDMYKSIGRGAGNSFRFLKKHPKFALSGLALVVLLVIGALVNSSMSNANRARADEERRLAVIAMQKDECVKKSQSSDLKYATTSFSGRDEIMDLKIGGYFLDEEKPEIFIDGQKIEVEQDKVKLEKNLECEELGVNFYNISVDLQSDDCKEKLATFKTSTLEKEKNVDNDGSCKTKAQIEADKQARAEEEARQQKEVAEREAREAERNRAEAERKATEEANKRAEEERLQIQDLLFEAEITCQQYAEVYFRVSDINIKYNQSSIKRKEPNGTLLIKANISDSRGAWKPDVPLGVMECITDSSGMSVVSFISY
jgi:hypothetical protein